MFFRYLKICTSIVKCDYIIFFGRFIKPGSKNCFRNKFCTNLLNSWIVLCSRKKSTSVLHLNIQTKHKEIIVSFTHPHRPYASPQFRKRKWVQEIIFSARTYFLVLLFADCVWRVDRYYREIMLAEQYLSIWCERQRQHKRKSKQAILSEKLQDEGRKRKAKFRFILRLD